VALDHGQRHVHVGRAGQVARGPHERVVLEDVDYPGDRHEDVVLGDVRLSVTALAAGPAIVAVPVAIATPAAAAAALVGVAVATLALLGAVLAAALARLVVPAALTRSVLLGCAGLALV
jgi:VIT1/CCC1 family predicted Fe2+/Mn2+ transporter